MPVTFCHSAVCIVAVAAPCVLAWPAAAVATEPKPVAEEITGEWERLVGAPKERVTLVLTFRGNESGGQFTLIRPGKKKGEVRFLVAAGFSYKLETRGGRKLLIIDKCPPLGGKKAEIGYELVGGKLRLAGGKTSEKYGGIDLKGDWTRAKKK